jgi:hypothetical protein
MAPIEESLERPRTSVFSGRIASLWRSPILGRATKAANAYAAKVLAKLNELLARVNAKK